MTVCRSWYGQVSRIYVGIDRHCNRSPSHSNREGWARSSVGWGRSIVAQRLWDKQEDRSFARWSPCSDVRKP